jgi:hypothetical protein
MARCLGVNLNTAVIVEPWSKKNEHVWPSIVVIGSTRRRAASIVASFARVVLTVWPSYQSIALIPEN